MKWYERPVQGDASETALVKFFQPIEDILKTRSHFKPALNKDKSEAKVDFNSAHKFVLKIYENNDESDQSCNYVAYMKGAPDRLWDKCSTILINGQIVPFTEEHKKKVFEANEHFGRNGQRVLGFTMMKLDKQKFPKGHLFDV